MKKAKQFSLLYTNGEEIFNGVTHIVGGGLGLIYLIFSIIYCIIADLGAVVLFANIVFGVSMINLYAMSSLYHMLRNQTAKKVFQVFDHCSIFLLIAGTYTPFILLGIPTLAGYIILAFVWLLSVLGIILNAIWVHAKPVKLYSYITYVLTGWSIVFGWHDLMKMDSVALLLLFWGGVAYSGGIVFYATGSKKKWFHSIWHLFVLLGTVFHFVSLLFLMRSAC